MIVSNVQDSSCILSKYKLQVFIQTLGKQAALSAKSVTYMVLCLYLSYKKC